MTYSVVIPAYNAEKTIETCLSSVLAQTFMPLEVLVVDDCSTDNTVSVTHSWQTRFALAGIECKCLQQLINQGPSAARNLGIREAKGVFVAFLDADDFWLEDKLAHIDQFATKSDASLICHSYAETVQPLPNMVQLYYSRRLSIWQLLIKNPAQTSCAVIRRLPQREFDETMRYSEDYDLWLRIAESAPVIQMCGPPLTYLGRPQLSVGGLSGNRWRMRVGEILAYYNFCNRAWSSRAFFLPFLLTFSLSKHLWQEIRRWIS